MRYGSLFAGIGGFDLGLDHAGLTCAWQVEIDEFCRKVLAKHWPDVQRFRDIRDFALSADKLAVDVICGGFPCQDVSISGGRKGLDGERSGLWHEFARVIRVLRPRYVVIENVAALLAPLRRDGRVTAPPPISRVLSDLSECGYDAEWQVISAARMGAPHRRERVFIVAYPSGTRLSGRFFDDGISSPSEKKRTKFGNRDITCGDWWRENLPSVFVGDGVSTRLARPRVKSLGNSIVPHISEWIGRRLMEIECIA